MERKPKLTNDPISIRVTESLKSFGVVDLTVNKFEQTQQDRIVYSLDSETTKPKEWTELSHLNKWICKFMELFKSSRKEIVALELIRMNKEHPLTLATYHVDEAISIIKTAASFKIPLDVVHPDTMGHNYAADNVLVEDAHSVVDIIREILIRLYSRCVVRLVVKIGYFYSSALSAFIVDLMHQAGATTAEIQVYAHDRRESICSERLTTMMTPNKLCKQSVFAVAFAATDLFAAVSGIIEGYFREQYPNLVVLVEEGAYSKFIKYWQHYYSHTLNIGSRLDDKVTVVDTFNEKVTIDLSAIDIRQSYKMTGNVINILRFRTLDECLSLINHLRKIPLMSVWNDDVLLTREFCSRINQCEQFWVNNMPKYHHAGRLPEILYRHHYDILADDMAVLYDKIYTQYQDNIEALQKMRLNFIKKDISLRNRLIFSAYLNTLNKYKSFKNGSTDNDIIARQQNFMNIFQTIREDGKGNRCVEEITSPIGMIIIHVAEEITTVKQKVLLLELIIKNLLLGNAVLVHCPPSTLAVKFSLENDHIIPFQMIIDETLDITLSNLTLDSSLSGRKKCPPNTSVVKFDTSFTSEMMGGKIRALCCKKKLLWLSTTDRFDYWSSKEIDH